MSDPDGGRSWPSDVRLRLTFGGSSAHVFYWFTECWRGVGEAVKGYTLDEGTIAFNRLRLLLADGAGLDPEGFATDGERWWQGFHIGDPRLGGEAQQRTASQAVRWRDSGSSSVLGTF